MPRDGERDPLGADQQPQGLGHARRRRVYASSFFTSRLARNVARDQRVLELSPGERWTLIVAALSFTDGAGEFWPKLRTFAKEASYARSAVALALGRAVELGIVTRHPHARPDGKQGSSTYRWDPALLPSVRLTSPEDTLSKATNGPKPKRMKIDGAWNTWVEGTPGGAGSWQEESG